MKYFFLILLYASFCTSMFAQAPRFKVTEKTIVKDPDGLVYPYNVWRYLVMQGDYEIKPIDTLNKKTDFLLFKLTEQQKSQRLEQMAKPAESDFFRTGKAFGGFKAEDIENNKINLKEEQGKIIVLNFWFINCPPCRMEIPALNDLVESYKGDHRVKFIGIALDRKYELQEFLKTVPFKYTIVENGRYFAERYGIRSFPTHVIINQEGKVYFHTTGLAFNTLYWLKKSITELLSQSSVAQH